MRSFLRDRSGNFATITAVLAIPIIGAAAAGIDLHSMTRERDALQNSLDSALLAAGRDTTLTLPQKKAKAETFLRANLKLLSTRNPMLNVRMVGGATSLEGEVTGTYDTRFMGVLGIREFKVTVTSAVAQGSDSFLDVALVLDATASLGTSGVTAVRDAANAFKTAVFDSATDPSYVQMAIVPFAGTVNVGRNFPRAFMDEAGDSYYHARHLEWRNIGYVPSSCPSGPNWGGGGPNDPGDGDVESSADKYIGHGWVALASAMAGDLLGVNQALAADNGEAQAHGLPAGFFMNQNGGCDWVVNPEKINHFDLFAQIANVDWAGCVEARREPYDTSDAEPSGDADRLFVPYFWPDEVDQYEFWVPEFVNNYMPDIQSPTPWTPSNWIEMGYWDRGSTITKYLGNPSVPLGALDPNTAGPNRGCPSPILPLTSNRTNVTAAISAYDKVSGGGTIISEGVAWGMRVLTPAQPFTQTRKDERTQRKLVVMSDGQNQTSVNPQIANGGQSYHNSPYVTDYNAYGYVRSGRLSPDDRISTFEDALDDKTQEACDAAKAEGIEVYTVLFRSTDQRARDTLRACASAPDKFYLAADSNELITTFQAIATTAGNYRLVK